MIFYFFYLITYYILIGICKFINNQYLTIGTVVLYCLLFIVLSIKNKRYKLLTINKFNKTTYFLILLVIPLINVGLIMINGYENIGVYEMLLLISSSIVEEFLFRVVIFKLLKYITYQRIIVTNILFSIVHLLNVFNGALTLEYVLVQIVYAFSIGVCLSILYIESKSIIPSIIIHILINITSISVYNNKGLLIYVLISIVILFIDFNYLRRNKNETLY